MANTTRPENYQLEATAPPQCSNVRGLYQSVALAAVNSFLSILASVGNFLILVALHKESCLRQPSKLLYRCLAVTDLIVGFLSQPLFATQLMLDVNELSQVCSRIQMLAAKMGLVFSGVSLMTATAISVDRLLALSLGPRYKQVVTLRRVGAVLSYCWLTGGASALIYSLWKSIVGILKTIVTSLCLIISAYSYTRIFFRLSHHKAVIQSKVNPEKPNAGGVPLNITKYRKTVSAALWVQITLLACYLPLVLVKPLQSVFSLSEVSSTVVSGYTSSLVFFNSTLNPFLYCWKMREVRKVVGDIVKWYCCRISS